MMNQLKHKHISCQIAEINARGCNPLTPCQSYEYLCQNGGTYVPLTPTNHTTPRYKCKCPTGYTGHLCQHAIKSCGSYSRGSRIPGKYPVFDDNMTLYEVFCDFDSKTKTVWTLVASYERQQWVKFDNPYYDDHPVNEELPRWDEYRLRKSRMQSIQNDSSKFRITCKYDTDGLMYDDFLMADKKHIDILSFNYRHTTSPVVCSFVEYANIRGEDCAFCTLILYQDYYTLHADSNRTDNGCEFKSTGSKDCGSAGEDNFGHYNCVNPVHRCSSSADATTQVWLGTVWL